MLMGIFLALSLIDVMFVSWLKRRSFTEEISGVQAGDSMRRFIVSKSVLLFALSEIPAILGLIIFFLSGNLIMSIVFWTLSLIAFLIARPPKELLDKADSVRECRPEGRLFCIRRRAFGRPLRNSLTPERIAINCFPFKQS